MTASRRAQELCEYCPRMCRSACPVSEATSREALTPGAKVSLAALSGRSPDGAAAMAFAGCTGCDRCTHHCAHDNDVAGILFAARASAVRAGSAPAAWNELALRFATRGHGEEADLAAVRQALPWTHGEAILFPGCESLARGGQVIRDALFVAERLGVPLGLAPEAVLCCGRKLLEGGHPEMHEAHGARVRGTFVRPRRPVHLVFLDPGCAAGVVEQWALPQGSRVEHITTYLLRLLFALPEGERPPRLPETLVFHDPCALARKLRETVAPRALLAAAVRDVRDPLHCGADTSCCGAAGLLPRSMPDVARRIAEERRAELGAGAVTSSPACAAALGATEVVSVLARWLAQGTR
jgi:fumarate reductase (CoM/CoB) subunit B